MYRINDFNNLEPLSIYLARPNGDLICSLNEYIDENSASLSIVLNGQYELSFDIVEDVDKRGWFDCLQEGMYLCVENVGLFKIAHPTLSNDGARRSKGISALSCDSELEDKNCTFSVNMGTETSYEFLIGYTDDDKDEQLRNPYTGLPYDYIVLYNTFSEQLEDLKNWIVPINEKRRFAKDTQDFERIKNITDLIPRLVKKYVLDSEDNDDSYVEYVNFEYVNNELEAIVVLPNIVERIDFLIGFYKRHKKELSLLDLVLEKTNGVWSVGNVFGVSDKKYTLANKRFNFDIDESIYSFFTQTLAQASECIFEFDLFKRKVNVTPVSEIGVDSGVNLSYDNLLNSMSVSPSDDTLFTRLYITGDSDLDIRQVNFGLPYIDNFDYKLNLVDSNGRRVYVSDDLAAKYKAYKADVDKKRDEYISVSREYSSINEEVTELRYRVPNDSLKTKWGTFKKDELEEHLTNYKNLRSSLLELFKEDFGSDGLYDEDGAVIEEKIKPTFYWYDYKAYTDTIKQIQAAIEYYPYYDNPDNWNCEEDTKKAVKEEIASWETDWQLYGTVELQAKISAYENQMKTMIEYGNVIVDSDKHKADDETFNSLSDDEKKSLKEVCEKALKKACGETYEATEDDVKDFWKYNEYTASFEPASWESLDEVKDERLKKYTGEENYKQNYNVYKTIYNNFKSAREFLYGLSSEVKFKEQKLTSKQNEMTKLSASVDWENWVGSSGDKFTPLEIKTLNLLIKESDYNNNNFVVTNIDTTDEVIDTKIELFKDGDDYLSKISRPQINFSIEAENVFALPKYQLLWTTLNVGNYILVQYCDDTYARLRLTGIKLNPCLPSPDGFELSFSNYILSKTKVSDLESVLGMATANGGRSSSSTGGSSGGAYGEDDDINVVLSNTMLKKLLNSESFGTRISDVTLNSLDAKVVNAQRVEVGNLATGTTVIDGACLQTGVISSKKKNNNNESCSSINLDDGTFNFAYGKFKSELKDNEYKVSIARWEINDDSLTSLNGSVGMCSSSAKKDGKIFFSTDNFYVTSDGYLFSKNGSIAGWNIGDNLISKGNVGISSSDGDQNKAFYAGKDDAFYVQNDGSLHAANADITGTIKASGGSIAGFEIHGDNTTTGSNGFWSKSLSSIFKDDNYEYVTFIRSGEEEGSSGLKSSNAVIGVKRRALTESSWSNETAPYLFRVQANGSVLMSNATFQDSSSPSWNKENPPKRVSIKDGVISLLIADEANDGSCDFKPLGVITSKKGGQITIPDNASDFEKLIYNAFNEAMKVYGRSYCISPDENNTYYVGIGYGLKTDSVVLPRYTSGISILNPSAVKEVSYLVSAIDNSSYLKAPPVIIGCDTQVSGSIIFNGESGHYLKTNGRAEETKNTAYNLIGFSGENNVVVGTVASGNSPSTGVDGVNVNVYGDTISLKCKNAKVGNSAIATSSDRRLKDSILPISDKYEQLFGKLSAVTYKYKNGSSGRTHTGFIAQDVLAAIESVGLTTDEFSAFVKSESDIKELDGYEYALRYSEFIALNTHMIQRCMSAIDDINIRLEAIENKLETLKSI